MRATAGRRRGEPRIGEPCLDALVRARPDAVLDALCAQQLRGSDRRITRRDGRPPGAGDG